jgi:hypothetical protein
VTPLYKVLMEGNKPSLPRVIGNWVSFFNADVGLIAKMSFLAGCIEGYEFRPACQGVPQRFP